MRNLERYIVKIYPKLTCHQVSPLENHGLAEATEKHGLNCCLNGTAKPKD